MKGRSGPVRASVSEMRRQLLRMVLLIVAIGAAALTIYQVADLEHARERTTRIFTLAWTVANFIVVAVQLRRIRRARWSSPPGARRGGPGA